MVAKLTADGWTEPSAVPGSGGGHFDVEPAVSLGVDGSNGLVWLRGSPTGFDLLASVRQPGESEWSPFVPVGESTSGEVQIDILTVTSDSMWVFIEDEGKLKAIPWNGTTAGTPTVFDNLGGTGGADYPHAVRLPDESIWVFWAAHLGGFPWWRGHYTVLSAGGWSEPALLPADGGCRLIDTEVIDGDLWVVFMVSSVEGGRGIHGFRLENNDWHEMIVGEDPGRLCAWPRLLRRSNGQPVVVYSCEVEDGQGGYSPEKYDLQYRTWNGSMWCPEGDFHLPTLPNQNGRLFAETALQPDGRIVVAYGEGTVRDALSSVVEVRAVPVLQPRVQLSVLSAGGLRAIVTGGWTFQLLVLRLWHRTIEDEPWVLLSSREVQSGQTTYEMGDAIPGEYYADVYDLAGGVVARSEPLSGSTAAREEAHVRWRRMDNGDIQFCLKEQSNCGPHELEIFTLRGRRVFQAPAPLSNQDCLTWKRVDQQGRRVGAGTYLYQSRPVGTGHACRRQSGRVTVVP